MVVRWLSRLWAAPISAYGLLLAAIICASGGQFRRQGIAFEATGGCASRLLWLMNPRSRIEAITLGHVIIVRDNATAERWRAHEHVHVRQYEQWGMFFPVAYAIASILAVRRGECAYRGNRFEKEAHCRGVTAKYLAPPLPSPPAPTGGQQ